MPRTSQSDADEPLEAELLATAAGAIDATGLADGLADGVASVALGTAEP
ncbi:MAG: hypothetical protein QOH99_458, partial [Frankiaceae bacterium]|nr:hypothetical protein [Frankiaceae bacterium]